MLWTRLGRGKLVERGEPWGHCCAVDWRARNAAYDAHLSYRRTASKVVEQTTLEAKHAGTVQYLSFDSTKTRSAQNALP